MNEQPNEILNQEIARELMLEHNPDLTQKKFEEVWALCQGNPFNAGILYNLSELKNEIISTQQR
jgi:hypothetical protein